MPAQKGVLMLPPFYYKNMSDKGLFDAFDEVIDKIADDRLKIYLYHFPQMSGVPITYGLIEMLLKAYSTVVCWVKRTARAYLRTWPVLQKNSQASRVSQVLTI